MVVTTNKALSLSNLRHPEIRANPYPFYAQIRSTDPVYWDESMGFWVLTNYADISTTLLKRPVSKAQGMTAALNRLPETEQQIAKPVYDVFARQILYADPPYHTHLRGLVNKTFTSRVVERLKPHIQQLVDELLDEVQPHGRMDVIRQLAYPLPIIIISKMLGLPPEERDRFKRWSDDAVGAVGIVRQEPGLIEKAHQSLAEFADYINDLQAQHQQQPQDNLLNALFTVEEQGAMLNREEVIANTLLLLWTGHETTTNLIGNGLLALLRHPDQMQKLKEDPTLITGAVDEFMRYDNPVQIIWRVAAEDFEIGGKQIRQGQLLNLLLGAANRDPAQFPNPDRLDLSRGPIRHAGFGFGSHYCFGAPLALINVEIAINTILRRMPTLQLETEALTWQEHPTFRGLKSLPVTF